MAYDPTDARAELETKWRSRLNVAEMRYRFAIAQFDKLTEEQRANMLSAPDGSFAISKARNIQSEALAEYMRVLHIFTELIVNNVTPTDP